MSLYRACATRDRLSPDRLRRAGKQAVCLVELKARFDEQNNIEWSRELEQRACTWSRLPGPEDPREDALVVRREAGGLRRYVHLGTGNYNPPTARLYEDVGLFTADEEIGADVADVFNYLTGFGRPRVPEADRRAVRDARRLIDGSGASRQQPPRARRHMCA